MYVLKNKLQKTVKNTSISDFVHRQINITSLIYLFLILWLINLSFWGGGHLTISAGLSEVAPYHANVSVDIEEAFIGALFIKLGQD